MIDLDSLDLKELKRLQKDVTAAIEQYKERERKRALAEVEAFARERGLSPADLSEISTKRVRKPVPPKYANPADRSQTWSGRGRQPRWVVAALADGRTLDDLAI
ncbi:MAG: DNA-binding protein H-NS [Rhodobacteraceae bacterium HLUCCA12]|nr:MAG: DNA-binding protein H-NS [Rhodobacteraceae bacterium HLUCCA12]